MARYVRGLRADGQSLCETVLNWFCSRADGYYWSTYLSATQVFSVEGSPSFCGCITSLNFGESASRVFSPKAPEMTSKLLF